MGSCFSDTWQDPVQMIQKEGRTKIMEVVSANVSKNGKDRQTSYVITETAPSVAEYSASPPPQILPNFFSST